MTPPRPLLGWRNSEAIGLKPKPANLSGVTRGLQFSRKLGCAACTKCPDSHPKPGRLGSSNMSALHTRERVRRRRGLVHSSGGRSQSRLRTMYQLPTHQQRRRLRPHSLQPHSGVHTPDKDFPLLADRSEAFAFCAPSNGSSLFTRIKATLITAGLRSAGALPVRECTISLCDAAPVALSYRANRQAWLPKPHLPASHGGINSSSRSRS